MNEFLQATPVINSDAPEIIALANELAGDAHEDEDAARRLFVWVRDEVRHSLDFQLPMVTCSSVEVLQHRAGFCYAKSHLLAALLRARQVPAALCYQRLALDSEGKTHCLHGLNAVHLRRHGWYRIDPRGNKPGIQTDFCPPIERLAFTPTLPGESDVPGLFADALPCVVASLLRWTTADQVAANLPDYVVER